MPSELIYTKPLQRELADSIVSLAHPDDIRILIACGAKVNDVVTQGLRPIHYAVWKRNAEALNLLLVRGCDVNSLDDCGYSGLHLAAEHGYTDMMRILLSNGAKTEYREDIDDTIQYPRTTISEEPLRLAIKNNHFVAARLLLEHGANPNAKYFFGSEINLLTPAELPFLELLLMFGADPNARDRQGLTPLMRACRHPDCLEAILCLLDYGADVNAMTDERHDNRTVLHYAVMSGNLDTIRLILYQGAKINFDKTYQKPTPLDLAILRGDLQCIQVLLGSGADVNSSSPVIGSCLHIAVSETIPNRLQILQILLENGADPNKIVISDDGMPLRSILGEYLASNNPPDIAVVKILLKYGCKVIVKTQFRHPLGILNCLDNVVKDNDLFCELMLSAESFDKAMIRRSSVLTPELKHFAIQLTQSPLTLKHQCRLRIREICGNQIISQVRGFGIPTDLEEYLLYEFS